MGTPVWSETRSFKSYLCHNGFLLTKITDVVPYHCTLNLIERNRSISGNSLGVERCLAKAKVAGSNPVSRSKKLSFFFFIYSHGIIFMKSIIEQASSIIKAIEKAWNQAEKPTEFSIKIFEQEERNFFGMSTKPAKIGIFFGDKLVIHEKTISKPQQKIKECRPSFASSSAKSGVYPESDRRGEHSKASECKPVSSKGSSTIEEKMTAKPTAQPTHKPQPAQPKQQAIPHTKANPQPIQPRVHNKSEKTQAGNVHTQNERSQDKPRRMPATWNDAMISTTHHWLKQTLSLMGLPSIGFNSEVAGKNLKLTFNSALIADPSQEKQLFRSFAHLIMSSLRNQYKQEIKDLKVVLIRPE